MMFLEVGCWARYTVPQLRTRPRALTKIWWHPYDIAPRCRNRQDVSDARFCWPML